MKQPSSYQPAWRANVGYAWREALAAVNCPLLLMAAPEDTFAHLLTAVRGGMPDAACIAIEDSAQSRAQAIRTTFSN